jgi:hypothetical protein
MVSGASQGVAEASGSWLATSTVEPRRAAAEVRQEPAMAEAQLVAAAQPAAPVVVALPASSVMEARQAPAAAEALREVEVAVPQQESTATVAQPAAEVAAPPQEPALAGSSQATAVEIPDDDTPPPGWDQWGSLPTPAPEPQAGALVRRWDGHMVAGGSRHSVEASSSRAAAPGSSGPAASPGQGQEHVDVPSPLFADAQEEQQLWEELRGHGTLLNRALNEALQIHGGLAWHVFQV